MWDREAGAVIQSSQNQQVRLRAVRGAKERVDPWPRTWSLREDAQSLERGRSLLSLAFCERASHDRSIFPRF